MEENKVKQNQTPRTYENIGGFEIRIGMAYNYNKALTPDKLEIRLLTEDFELGEAMISKLKEWLSS